MKILPRHIKSSLLEALGVSPVVFLNGIRQSGKSTLVQNLRDTIEANKPLRPMSHLIVLPKWLPQLRS